MRDRRNAKAKRWRAGWGLAMLACLAVGPAAAQAPETASRQSIYLPVYSHVYYGNPDKETQRPSQTLVSAHISIRNTDARTPITVGSAKYYDTDGKLLREFVPLPRSVPPLGTLELFVPRADTSGGSGANFLIEWSSAQPVSAPLIEALHADIREARTLFFVTTGRVVQQAR